MEVLTGEEGTEDEEEEEEEEEDEDEVGFPPEKCVISFSSSFWQVLHPVRRESVSKEALRRGSMNGMDVEGEEDEGVGEIYRKICENLRHNLESIKAYKKVNFSCFFCGLF